jgi:hypothetical protein
VWGPDFGVRVIPFDPSVTISKYSFPLLMPPVIFIIPEIFLLEI